MSSVKGSKKRKPAPSEAGRRKLLKEIHEGVEWSHPPVLKTYTKKPRLSNTNGEYFTPPKETNMDLITTINIDDGPDILKIDVPEVIKNDPDPDPEVLNQNRVEIEGVKLVPHVSPKDEERVPINIAEPDVFVKVEVESDSDTDLNISRDDGTSSRTKSSGLKAGYYCSCTKSQCLKLYCQCFAHGNFCTECNCVNCENTGANTSAANRQQAMKEAWENTTVKIDKDPDGEKGGGEGEGRDFCENTGLLPENEPETEVEPDCDVDLSCVKVEIEEPELDTDADQLHRMEFENVFVKEDPDDDRFIQDAESSETRECEKEKTKSVEENNLIKVENTEVLEIESKDNQAKRQCTEREMPQKKRRNPTWFSPRRRNMENRESESGANKPKVSETEKDATSQDPEALLLQNESVFMSVGEHPGEKTNKYILVKSAKRTLVQKIQASTSGEVQQEIQKAKDVVLANVQKAFEMESKTKPVRVKKVITFEKSLQASKYIKKVIEKKPVIKIHVDKKESAKNCDTAAFLDPKTGTVRIYDKRHACLFCEGRFLNFSRHLLSCHADRKEIAFIKSISADSDRKLAFIRLRRIANFQHNLLARTEGKNELIVLRSSEAFVKTHSMKMFFPCPDCAGFVHKSRLQSHHERCVLTPTIEIEDRDLKRESQALMECYGAPDHTFQMKIILGSMNSLKYGIIAKGDPLIVLLGQFLYNHRVINSQGEEVKLVMAKMGAFLMACRDVARAGPLPLHMVLDSKYLQLMSAAAESMMSSSDSDNKSLSLFLYNKIITCVFLWRGKCLYEGLIEKAETILQFYYDFVSVWSNTMYNIRANKVSKQYVKTQVKGLTALPPVYPNAATVVALKQGLTSNIVSLTNRLKGETTSSSLADRNREYVLSLWRNLTNLTMSLICLLNPLDFSIIESLSLMDYALRPDWNVDDLNAFKGWVSSVAYLLAEKRTLVRNNNNKSVILLTHELKRAIDVLLAKRDMVQVSVLNKYLFAKPNDISNPMRASNCFYSAVLKDGDGSLNNLMQDIRVRNYVALVMQISDMSPDEVEYLQNCLKTSDQTNNTVDVKFDVHLIAQVFKDINLNEKILINKAYDRTGEAVNINSERETQELRKRPDVQDPSEHRIIRKTVTTEKFCVICHRRCNFMCSGCNVPVHNRAHCLDNLDHFQRQNGGKVYTVQCKWRPEEVEYMKLYFWEEIENEKVPGRDQCLACLDKAGTYLVGKTWWSVKCFVYNEIEKMKQLVRQENPLFCDLDQD